MGADSLIDKIKRVTLLLTAGFYSGENALNKQAQ